MSKRIHTYGSILIDLQLSWFTSRNLFYWYTATYIVSNTYCCQRVSSTFVLPSRGIWYQSDGCNFLFASSFTMSPSDCSLPMLLTHFALFLTRSMLCFTVLAMEGLVRLAKNSSISLAFSSELNWKDSRQPNCHFSIFIVRMLICCLRKQQLE